MKVTRSQLRRLIENIIDADDRFSEEVECDHPMAEVDGVGAAGSYDAMARDVRNAVGRMIAAFDEQTARDAVEEAFADLDDSYQELVADRTMDDRVN